MFFGLILVGSDLVFRFAVGRGFVLFGLGLTTSCFCFLDLFTGLSPGFGVGFLDLDGKIELVNRDKVENNLDSVFLGVNLDLGLGLESVWADLFSLTRLRLTDLGLGWIKEISLGTRLNTPNEL